MKKELRVKTKEDFQKVIASRKKVNSDIFVIYFKKSDGVDYARFGISASKKLGHAVIRVKTRRQVRSMIDEITKNEYIKPMDYVIIVRNRFLDNSYKNNLEDLKKLFIRIGGKTDEQKQ